MDYWTLLSRYSRHLADMQRFPVRHMPFVRLPIHQPESDFAKTAKFTVEQVARWFDVPAHMIRGDQ